MNSTETAMVMGFVSNLENSHRKLKFRLTDVSAGQHLIPDPEKAGSEIDEALKEFFLNVHMDDVVHMIDSIKRY